jgi:electron transfer flavoprotein alpha/beta subunit
MNPEDRHGVELAVGLKERFGGKVVAVTMGPPQAVDVLTEALGMGADEGVILCDPFFRRRGHLGHGVYAWFVSGNLETIRFGYRGPAGH